MSEDYDKEGLDDKQKIHSSVGAPLIEVLRSAVPVIY